MEIKKGRYRHFKGRVYDVVGSATNSETLEEVIVYRSAEDGTLWVRPASMWNETVARDGKLMPRFTLLEESD
ncbi:MAG: DUF1653 domain-containing protein [Christensenellales bacterium]